ncbi:hypothetical protein L0B52_06550 [Suttonella sp. R2A3]|uniref:hypothetical protein n=1 Tax=Suttonella sp. R2A3 TaxID=2908648 RepID=UPI001F1BFE1A|nr:hypothetical protein [Suttonella sp. R2A3]UJF23997.1 hypothetical protein L0B52_06550 [Suttonella sp. R2A3]
MTIQTLISALCAIGLLSGCAQVPLPQQPEVLAAQNGSSATEKTAAAISDIHPFIVNYFKEIQDFEKEFCDSLQYKDPMAYCYGELNMAYIKPRIAYQDEDVALLTSEGIKEMEGSGGFGGDVLSLHSNKILYGDLGYSFSAKRQDNTLIVTYEGRDGLNKEVVPLPL